MIENIRKNLKYFIILLLILLLVLTSGIFIIRGFNIAINPSSLFNLALVFALISGVTITIVFAGQARELKDQPGYTLFAISLKFLAEMVVALIWFMNEKKSDLPEVLLFFLLYLTFSLFSIITIVKTLKNKAL